MSKLIETDEAFLRDASTRIKLRMSRTAQDIIEIGRDLIAVKERVGHGHFLPWINAEFGMSEATALRFTHVAENLKSVTVTDLKPAVLYALAAPSMPEEVREAVANKVAAGDTIGVSDVKRLRDEIKARDDKLKKLKSQKEASDSHNGQLVDEVRSKSAETRRLSDQIKDLQEELRRTSEPGTVTVLANPEPWRETLLAMWRQSPIEVRQWFLASVSTQVVS